MVWHDFMALLLVAAAAAVVLRKVYKFFAAKPTGTGCGTGCGTCPAGAASPPTLLSIGDAGTSAAKLRDGRDRR